MKVWLDDLRPAPSGWIWVKTPPEAISLLQGGEVEEMSLDHDLGLFDSDGLEQTGGDVLYWVESQLVVHGRKPPLLSVHSANPPARQKMERAIRAIEQRGEKL